MIRYKNIAPRDETETRDEAAEPETAQILDECLDFVADHVVATDGQLTAMIGYAAATWALSVCPAFGRLGFFAPEENSGKTRAMDVTASLCANPVSAKGTLYALQAELAAAQNRPEDPSPTLFYDEISGLYGTSGLNRGGNWVLDDILRDGYRQGATRKWSVNRVATPFSIYCPVLMTGRHVSIPADVRSRTIVINMQPGQPRKYFDERESRPWAKRLARSLRDTVQAHLEEIAEFRARGVHPKLEGRRLEVWEPVFASTYVLGGQRWLNRCMQAFMELSLSESEQVSLSPRQEVIKDAAGALDRAQIALPDGTLFAGGLALADEMLRLDNPLYRGRTQLGMARLIAESLPPKSRQVRLGKERIMGYFAEDILRAWEAVRPENPADTDLPEEVNPFAVRDDDSDLVFENGSLSSVVRDGKHVRSRPGGKVK